MRSPHPVLFEKSRWERIASSQHFDVALGARRSSIVLSRLLGSPAPHIEPGRPPIAMRSRNTLYITTFRVACPECCLEPRLSSKRQGH
eukprot:6666786-Pyramimonas_sp.AAC.1